MPRRPWHLIAPLLRRPAVGADADPVSDAELLRRFAESHDQAAFELLVWRHGGLVLGACRRVLRDDHAAEDAFQATFLVLARKAGGVRTNLPAWLHRVARRVSLRLAKQRRHTEPLAGDLPARSHAAPDTELAAILDAEIDRLPDRFRRPVVLCYLGGRSTDDAAKELGVPRGTVLSRLATARQRLAARLTRRGITAPAAGLLAVSATEPLAAEVVHPCVTAAARFASGTTIGTLPAVELAQGVLRMGARITIAAWAAVLLATAGLGTGVAVVAGGGDEPKPTAAQPGPVPKPPATPAASATAPADRSRQVAALRERLSQEREKLNDMAAAMQDRLTRLDADQLNPHVEKAMGEVLTQVELSIFRTQTELLNNEPALAELRRTLAAAEEKPLASYGAPSHIPGPGGVVGVPGMGPGVPAALVQKFDLLQRKEAEAERAAAQVSPDSPVSKAIRAEVAQLRTEVQAAVRKATEDYQRSQKEQEKQRLADELRSAEAAHQAKVRAIDTLRKQRDEIVQRLTKADRAQNDTQYRRLTDELSLLREQSAQIARTIMALELEEAKGSAGLPPPAASDDKLDRVLRELADLKAEVRRLSAERR